MDPDDSGFMGLNIFPEEKCKSHKQKTGPVSRTPLLAYETNCASTPKRNYLYNEAEASFVLPLNFDFSCEDKSNITGTKIKVKNVANPKPKIIVHESGPQKATLSPPKKMCGFNSLNKVTKSILNPTASGIKPKIVADAVSSTGVIRVLPASIIASFIS